MVAVISPSPFAMWLCRPLSKRGGPRSAETVRRTGVRGREAAPVPGARQALLPAASKQGSPRKFRSPEHTTVREAQPWGAGRRPWRDQAT